MKKNFYIGCFILICIPFKSIGQNHHWDDESEFKFIVVSLGAGGFFANRHVANYYNGRKENVNKIEFALKNTQFLDAVKERLGGRDFWFGESDLPAKMRYKLSTIAHFRAAINLSPYTSVFLQVNQVNLTAADIFVINVLDPPNFEPKRIQCNIWGKESRTMLDIGFQWRDDLEARNWQWFFELAFNVTNTRARENYIEIEGLKQSIVYQGNFIPGQGFSSVPYQESALGIGLVGSLGWRYVVTPSASLDFGVTAYLQDINLTGYKKFHPNFNIFARLNFLMF